MTDNVPCPLDLFEKFKLLLVRETRKKMLFTLFTILRGQLVNFDQPNLAQVSVKTLLAWSRSKTIKRHQ